MALSCSLRLLRGDIHRRVVHSAFQTTCAVRSSQNERSNIPHESYQQLDTGSTENLKPNHSNLHFASIGENLSLCRTLSRLSLSPTEVNLSKEYILPSLHKTNDVAILDPLSDVGARDCPDKAIKPSIESPKVESTPDAIDLPLRGRVIEKHAKLIMFIRHRKMKKHKYKKWRKRNKFLLRARHAQRLLKRKAKWEAWVEERRFKGLTQEDIEIFMDRKKTQETLTLKFMGIPVEPELTEKEKRRKMEEELKEMKKKTSCLDPTKSGMIVPPPIVPPGANINRSINN